jgi:hypothetical protein
MEIYQWCKLDSLTFADTGGKHKSSPSAFYLLTNLKETDKDIIIMGNDWKLVDKHAHAWHDLKQNTEIGNVEAALYEDLGGA